MRVGQGACWGNGAGLLSCRWRTWELKPQLCLCEDTEVDKPVNLMHMACRDIQAAYRPRMLYVALGCSLPFHMQLTHADVSVHAVL